MKFLPPTLAVLAALIGGSALAQPSALPPPPPMAPPAAPDADDSPAVGVISGNYTLHQREDRLETLLKSSVADGSLGHRQFGLAIQGLEEIRATEDRLRHRHNGELTDAETFRLEARLRTLAASIHWKP